MPKISPFNSTQFAALKTYFSKIDSNNLHVGLQMLSSIEVLQQKILYTLLGSVHVILIYLITLAILTAVIEFTAYEMDDQNLLPAGTEFFSLPSCSDQC
jgi:hypothetical protein